MKKVWEPCWLARTGPAKAQIAASIPKTLARLERAALNWHGFYALCEQDVESLQKLQAACAAHAKWKAKQRRMK